MTTIAADLHNRWFQAKEEEKMALARFQKIKGITGSTPNNFIMNLRLKKAAYFLLNAPEMNISDIAYRLGFGNPQYFNKCFKELFDIAPTQYRKSHDAPSDPSVK